MFSQLVLDTKCVVYSNGDTKDAVTFSTTQDFLDKRDRFLGRWKGHVTDFSIFGGRIMNVPDQASVSIDIEMRDRLNSSLVIKEIKSIDAGVYSIESLINTIYTTFNNMKTTPNTRTFALEELVKLKFEKNYNKISAEVVHDTFQITRMFLHSYSVEIAHILGFREEQGLIWSVSLLSRYSPEKKIFFPEICDVDRGVHAIYVMSNIAKPVYIRNGKYNVMGVILKNETGSYINRQGSLDFDLNNTLDGSLPNVHIKLCEDPQTEKLIKLEDNSVTIIAVRYFKISDGE